MKLTIKENVNKESKVLKHKIALEAVTLLSEEDNILDTEAELYTMLALVDNFCEENILDEIGDDEREFAAILENDVEPAFNLIIEKYDYKDIYEDLLQDVLYYVDKRHTQINTLVGIINEVYKMTKHGELDDLKFFFNKVATEFNNAMYAEETKKDAIKEEKKKVEDKKTFDGASEKLNELLTQFQSQVSNEQKINVENNQEK